MSQRYTAALAGEVQSVPPVWCMRQAGRYQRSYQALRKKHSFEALCREPDLSARVALDSVAEFDFDAAILFSDLLFPLDALGLPVTYDDRGPHIGKRLDETNISTLATTSDAIRALQFQSEAVATTRKQLPDSKGLIGFIGGPWTLFVYAVEGSHAGSLSRAKGAVELYEAFAERITPVLAEVARAQIAAGADLVMIFDTAAGELSPAAFHSIVAPDIRRLAAACPGQLGYYARGLHPAHLSDNDESTIGSVAGLGVDWRWDMRELLATPGRRGFLQGNFDPALLQLSGPTLDRALEAFLAPIASLSPEDRRGWVCGLGHGVMKDTPEESVRHFVRTVRERLA